jgi:outer membrane protein TolC
MKLALQLITYLVIFQGTLVAQEIVSEEEFIQLVIKYHPIAIQADLREDIGNAKLLKAKGWFDPKLSSDYNQKSFDGENYFQVLDGGVKIPTWIGADVKLAYNWNNGLFINPENNLPSNGLLSAGIELPVLRGLIFDKRRADLQQGKNYTQMGQLEKQQLLNELVYDASQAYWMWFEANRKFVIANEGVVLAEATFNFVKASSRLGDKPAIDTLEALIQVQNRDIDKQSAALDLMNAKLWASSFLWLEEYTPAQISEEAAPMPFSQDEEVLASFLEELELKEDSLLQNNPKLRWYDYKLQNLNIDRKLAKEQLKPVLNLGYNFITQPLDQTLFDQFNIANYKWNVNLAVPLFMREERGNLKIMRAEFESASAELSNLQLQQENKIQAIKNKIDVYISQLSLTSKNIEDNRALVNAEKRKFNLGESSVFLVNFREISFLKVLQKQAELQAKLKVALAELEMAIGW